MSCSWDCSNAFGYFALMLRSIIYCISTLQNMWDEQADNDCLSLSKVDLPIKIFLQFQVLCKKGSLCTRSGSRWVLQRFFDSWEEESASHPTSLLLVKSECHKFLYSDGPKGQKSRFQHFTLHLQGFPWILFQFWLLPVCCRFHRFRLSLELFRNILNLTSRRQKYSK